MGAIARGHVFGELLLPWHLKLHPSGALTAWKPAWALKGRCMDIREYCNKCSISTHICVCILYMYVYIYVYI